MVFFVVIEAGEFVAFESDLAFARDALRSMDVEALGQIARNGDSQLWDGNRRSRFFPRAVSSVRNQVANNERVW